MFVPDLLHEFELGVWKATFTHLMCILYAMGGTVVQELNKRYIASPMAWVNGMANRWDRYRAIPTFGRGVIRRFSRNAASMKKLAARDFEDLLQVMSAWIYCDLPVC